MAQRTEYSKMQADYINTAKADNAAHGHTALCGFGFGGNCNCPGVPVQEACREPELCAEDGFCSCNMPEWY